MTLNWSIRVQTGDSAQEFQGKQALRRGENRVICDLPEGVLQSVTAEIPVALSDQERVFLNGYQTWTYCPEYGKTDKIRGLHGVPKALVRKYDFDRYGDYHFVDYPNRRGVTHGVSYGYFRRDQEFRLVASLDEAPGYTLLEYDWNRGLLTLRRDCAGVRCGGSFHGFDLYLDQGREAAVFDGWFQAMHLGPPQVKPLAGYSSWYNRYEAISEQTILADLAGCQTLLQPGDLFQIDDGWEPNVGDWLEPGREKFPNGLKPLVEKIHAAGYQAGLWLAPFVCRKGSRLMEAHPDWLLQINGKPWSCGCNWGGFYALDLDQPDVQDYLRRTFDQVLRQWDFDLVKLDFLYGAAPFGTDRESRAGRMIRAMDFLRELCGDKRILGCGVPVMPAFGRVDYCRVGCDVSLDWDDKWFMRAFHRERVSTRHSIQNTVFRRQLDGRAFHSDPDVFFLRRENIQLSPEKTWQLAQLDALLGSTLLTSDDPSAYDQSQRQQYAQLLSLRRAQITQVDPEQDLQIHYTLDGTAHCFTIPDWKKK
jgi:alpha-galactosidase